MAELPSDEENELNFSDYDDDSDDDANKQRPPTSSVIAHKEMPTRTTETISDAEDSDKEESDGEIISDNETSRIPSPQELEFENISPPQQSDNEEDYNKNDKNDKQNISDNEGPPDDLDKQTFEPISPVSDHENNFETISPPDSPVGTSKQPQFENISEDEDEEENKKVREPEMPEGKFSPVQESDNELNFDDENSNDSGYQIIQPEIKTPQVENTETKTSASPRSPLSSPSPQTPLSPQSPVHRPPLTQSPVPQSELPPSELPKSPLPQPSPPRSPSPNEEVKEPEDFEEDIEAPMPSPFSDIGDLEDITELADGQIISDILKDTDATEQQFEMKGNMEEFPVDDDEGEGLPPADDEGGEGLPPADDEGGGGGLLLHRDVTEHQIDGGEVASIIQSQDLEGDAGDADDVGDAADAADAGDAAGAGDADDTEHVAKDLTEIESQEKEVEEEHPAEDKESNEDAGKEKLDEVQENGEEEEGDGEEVEKGEDDKEGKEDEEEGDEDAGDLIADIFGDSDEEEEFEGFADEEMPEGEEEKADESDDEVQPVKEVVAEEDEREGAQKDESSDDEPRMPVRDFVNDFDLMIEKKKEAKRAQRRSKKDVDLINDNDEIIASMINKMKQVADEDRMLNQAGKAATKKLKMLPSVLVHLKKSDLQMAFIDCGVLNGMKEWLSPLPDHALPHINIRKTFLQILMEFPALDKSALKSSGIGRAIMLLWKHPKEVRENKQMAGKIISNWARPIFNVSTNFLDMSKEEREARDKKTLDNKRRLSKDETEAEPKLRKLDKEEEDNENKPRKPGDKGWVGRARVPQASARDYVNRPQSKLDQFEQTRALNTKKPLNRYEQHANKMKKKKPNKLKAMGISVSGSKMGL